MRRWILWAIVGVCGVSVVVALIFFYSFQFAYPELTDTQRLLYWFPWNLLTGVAVFVGIIAAKFALED